MCVRESSFSSRRSTLTLSQHNRQYTDIQAMLFTLTAILNTSFIRDDIISQNTVLDARVTQFTGTFTESRGSRRFTRVSLGQISFRTKREYFENKVRQRRLRISYALTVQQHGNCLLLGAGRSEKRHKLSRRIIHSLRYQ